MPRFCDVVTVHKENLANNFVFGVRINYEFLMQFPSFFFLLLEKDYFFLAEYTRGVRICFGTFRNSPRGVVEKILEIRSAVINRNILSVLMAGRISLVCRAYAAVALTFDHDTLARTSLEHLLFFHVDERVTATRNGAKPAIRLYSPPLS